MHVQVGLGSKCACVCGNCRSSVCVHRAICTLGGRRRMNVHTLDPIYCCFRMVVRLTVQAHGKSSRNHQLLQHNGVYHAVLPELGPTRFTSPMSKEEEYVFEAVFVSELRHAMGKATDMRHLCKPDCGPQLELPFRPHSSAPFGSGNRADGNAKAESEASQQFQAWCIIRCCMSMPISGNAV